MTMLRSVYSVIAFWSCIVFSYSQTPTFTVVPEDRFQVIDGFGAHQSGEATNQSWFHSLYFDDMECSIYRVDLTPSLRSPYSDLSYYSPWFMGSQTKSVFNFEDPANPNGPENNRVRTYTGPLDYSRSFGGRNAPIAVMGPNIEQNLQYFTYRANDVIKIGNQKKSQLGDFKLVGSLWSPLPWVKVSSGNRYPENWWPGPVQNAPWPFIWGGNFSGGRLDVSNQTLSVFDDRSVGGTGPTSALTQFVRSTAAYILGYQRFHNAKFYAISIQNELNFEVFYNSCTYPLSSQYITAIKAIRAEFNKHPELKDIKIMGPEDLLGGDAYGMWEYGGPIHKNLQYLQNITADTAANRAIDFWCIHGYADDGVTGSGATPREWSWWANGWTTSPAAGIPGNVKGFLSTGKKSWMTETSGENREWIFPKNGFPGEGGFGVGIRILQALAAGRESAWIYWTFADADDAGQVSVSGLTSQLAGFNSPKYVAAKHFFKLIRPNAQRVVVSAIGSTPGIINPAAFIHEVNKTVVVVLMNMVSTPQSINLTIPNIKPSVEVFTSYENSYWKQSTHAVNNNTASINLPPYSIVTVKANNINTATDPEIVSVFDLNVFPNPCISSTTITFTLPTFESIKLELLNLHGEKIHDWNYANKQSGIHTLEIPTSHLNSGIYFVKIQSSRGSEIRKIVVK